MQRPSSLQHGLLHQAIFCGLFSLQRASGLLFLQDFLELWVSGCRFLGEALVDYVLGVRGLLA